MPNQPWPERSRPEKPWLDEIEQQLVKNRLPTTYIRRFMDELTDHFQDVTEDMMNKETNTTDLVSRLGDPNQLADTATLAYRQRTFFGRHPSAKLLVFGVSPILSLVGLFALALGCLIGFGEVYGRLGFDLHIAQFEPIASTVLPYVFSLMMVVIPAILADIFYCKLARRFDIDRKWMLVSFVMLAILAFLPIWTVKLSGVPHQSSIGIGLRVPQTTDEIVDQTVWYFSNLRQIFQFLTPLAVGLWLMWRTRKRADEQQNEPLRLAA